LSAQHYKLHPKLLELATITSLLVFLPEKWLLAANTHLSGNPCLADNFLLVPMFLALTICFQDGWPAMHRVLRNRTFAMWDAVGCPAPGKRPGEGDPLLTRPDGSKVLR